MRNYRHVLKRFPIHRNLKESHSEFIARIDNITEIELQNVQQQYKNLDLDEHTSFIWSDDKNPYFTQAVVEIYELPELLSCGTVDLLLYHDTILQTESGNTTDINLEDAAVAIGIEINRLKAAAEKVHKLMLKEVADEN